jgi:Transmembrane protein 43
MSNEENTSFWSQVWRSPRLIAGGGTAFLAALGMLVNNETSSKHASDMLSQAQKEIRVTSADAVDASMEGKLVSLSGTFSSKQGAQDSEFNVRSQGVALKRQVLMYQWIEYAYEEGRRRNRRTVYEYEMGWSDVYQDSSQFNVPQGHTNPPMSMRSQVFIAPDAKLGAYQFTDAELLSAALPVQMGEYMEEAEADLAGSLVKSDLSGISQPISTLPGVGLKADQGWVLQENAYYKATGNSEEAELGDLYVSFTQVPNGSEITLIGQQEGDQIKPWKADGGETLFLAREGQVNARQWLGEAIAASSKNLSVERWMGMALATLGFASFAAGLGAWLQNLPIFGRLLSFGMWLGGAFIGFTFGLIAMAIGWLSARPIVALLLVAALVAAICWRVLIVNKRVQAQRQSRSIIEAAELARQRQQERSGAGTPPPAPTGPAPIPTMGSMPPPLPNAATGKANMQVAASVPEMMPNGDLPAFEWTPSSSSNAPPAVMPKKAVVSAPSYGSDPNEGIAFEPEAKKVPAPPANVAAPKPKVKREVLGEKGGFTLTKIVFVDGPKVGEIMCFELMKEKAVLVRGTQDEVKTALKSRLSSAAG